jgi:carbon monoxide dehydrogenase subunit G
MSLNRFGMVVLSLILLMVSPLSWADYSVSPPQVVMGKEEGAVKTLRAEAVINAPIDIVWQELSNYGNMKNMLPGYERSTLLQSAGSVKKVDFQVKASGFLPSFHYLVKIREDKPAYRLQIQRISGDFKAINASYQLIPIEGGARTRVLYNLSIDLGSLPSFGVSSVLKANSAKAMLALQSHCAGVYSRSLTAQAIH